MQNFLKEIEKRILVYDGSKGYMLQKYGLKGGECPELWNVTHSNEVKEIYSLYKKAGSDVIQTNTFSGNKVQLEKHGVGDKIYELNYKGARLAKEVMGKDGFVAGSIGPTGRLFEPSGDLIFEEAYTIFKEQIKALVDGGIDLINFETFTDVAEMRAALLAAKETTDIPVICSISFEQNGRTLMGTDPQTAVITLKSLGADMVGTNCSFGPELMVDIVEKMHLSGAGYLSIKPNAGLPEIVNGVPVYRESAKKFVELIHKFIKYGGRLIGGCCGTTPEFISAIKEEINKLKETESKEIINNLQIVSDERKGNKNYIISSKIITSGVRSFDIGNINDVSSINKKNIGELIPEDDDKILYQLRDMDLNIVKNMVSDMALDIAYEDFDVVYVNVDKTFHNKDNKDNKDSNSNKADKESEVNKDENMKNSQLLAEIINVAQGYIKQPFIIETRDSKALENALRIYRGRAGIIIDKKLAAVNDKLTDNLISVSNKYGALTIFD